MKITFLHDGYKKHILSKRYSNFVVFDGHVMFTNANQGYKVLWNTLIDNSVEVV